MDAYSYLEYEPLVLWDDEKKERYIYEENRDYNTECYLILWDDDMTFDEFEEIAYNSYLE